MAGQQGRSGRRKKPAVIRKLEGKRGHRPIPDEPKADGLPKMPDHLTDEERRAWLATVQYLPKGLLTGADSAFLEVYAVAWATFREARRAINKSGQLVRGSDGQPVRNPWKAIARQAAAEMNTFGGQLGMSPLSRTRLVAADNGEVDPLELLLGMQEQWADVPKQ